MVEALQFSTYPAPATNAPFLISEHGTTAGTNDAEIQDTVTLSAAALVASRFPNLLAFPYRSAVVIAQNALPSVIAEFPVEELLEKGYSASQIAIDLGIPAETLNAELGIQAFHAAA